ALYPWALPPSLNTLPPPMTPPLSITELPPLPSYGNTPGPPFFTSYSLSNLPKGVFGNAKIYVPALAEPPGIYPAGFNPGFNPYAASTDPYLWPIESSACVLKSLQQGRGGPALTE